jgi:hypothetical protein
MPGESPARLLASPLQLQPTPSEQHGPETGIVLRLSRGGYCGMLLHVCGALMSASAERIDSGGTRVVRKWCSIECVSLKRFPFSAR